ncbi:MAG: hypothetical protein GVY29_05965 [Spirochaetes bacterium]|jgi:replication initiation and membrane attachment protein DnaB|nr:hypothetical protein [Spirochaetota bacterium]
MTHRDSHAEILARVLKKLPPVVVQNRLMATSDRDVALSLLYFNDEEREPILSAVSTAKKRRIQEEIVLQERLRISRKHYETAVSQLIAALQQNTPRQSQRSYIRPHKPRQF